MWGSMEKTEKEAQDFIVKVETNHLFAPYQLSSSIKTDDMISFQSRFRVGKATRYRLPSLAAFFIVDGVMHFVAPDAYVRIVPPVLPVPRLLVLVSGIAEVFGGCGLVLPSTQRPAAWGLILLLLAVFPANIYTAVSHVSFPGVFGQSWVQWLRLPLQIPLILWALRYTKRSTAAPV
jgi:uncharacterized membrane protein